MYEVYMLKMKILFFVVFISVSSASNVLGCLCKPDRSTSRQIARLRKDSDAIFVGKVIKVEKVIENQTVAYKATFEVEKSWKGELTQIYIFTEGGCKVWFVEGKHYLVYAKRNESQDLQTNICMRTGLIDYAKVDLKELGKSKQ